VAQGSCLSPLVANIYLNEFDKLMNKQGIICFRYIDDLLIFGKKKTYIEKAFHNGKQLLNEMGLEIYDPLAAGEKSDQGRIEDGFEFLGCKITPGFIQPSKKNRTKFIKRIEKTFKDSINELGFVGKRTLDPKKACINTLENVNNAVLGWGHAFSFCNDYQILAHLDEQFKLRFLNYISLVQKKVNDFPLEAVNILGLFSVKKIAEEKKKKTKGKNSLGMLEDMHKSDHLGSIPINEYSL